MKPIPAAIVDHTRREIDALVSPDRERLFEKMGQDQPYLLGYLTAMGEETFNQAEQGVFLCLGLVLWRIMSRGERLPESVSVEAIERAEETNFKMIEYLEKEPEAEFTHTVRLMMNGYNQMEVLRYILQMLMEEPEVQEAFRDDYKGLAMIYLKTIIDCLDQ